MDSDQTQDLIAALRAVVGRKHVLVGDRRTRRYCTGYRAGVGNVVAVVRPGSLVQQWRTLRICIGAGCVVIPQAANTGLTGGSTPDEKGYDRPVVLVSLMRLKGLHLIDEGRQVICLPGSTLRELEDALRPLGREPHSVIGSSCIGASVIGGVSNSSGGALMRRGPAFTRHALFAQIDQVGELRLVNHLGVALGERAETILARLEDGRFDSADITPSVSSSDTGYGRHVRAIDEPTPARYNADPRTLFEASGNAGKLMVFAVRLDTFQREDREAVFYIGTNDPDELERLRRDALMRFESLPVAAEYIHREAYDLARHYGKDTYLAIRHLGMRGLPRLFSIKARIDNLAGRLRLSAFSITDRLLQLVGLFAPPHLPRRMEEWRDRFEHHLLLQVAGPGIDEAQAYLSDIFPSSSGDVFLCSAVEASAAFLHRFVVASAGVRYRALHGANIGALVSLDIALPRNVRDWFETLPAPLKSMIRHRIYYGHFFCHVFHQDYLLKKGCNAVAFKRAVLEAVAARGGVYPAEHNVGHIYPATKALAAHYRTLDPTNCCNPGVGQLPRGRHWTGPACDADQEECPRGGPAKSKRSNTPSIP